MSFHLRFPFEPERHPRRARSPRRAIQCAGLKGAQFYAAQMINSAIQYRDQLLPIGAPAVLHRRIARLGMRANALRARAFAGQLAPDDRRIEAALTERERLIREYTTSLRRV